MIETTVEIGRLAVQNGAPLDRVKQRVTIYGDPAHAEKVVLVTHALSGSSRVAEWWSALIGSGKLFDPAHQCIIGINALGSCYGSTGPADADDFPLVTVADMVKAQARALRLLGINHVDVVAGGSLGGMQALQWILAYPARVGHAIVIGAYDHFSAQGIAFNAVAREAIRNDPVGGLALARKIAMLTYKSDALLEGRHANRRDRNNFSKFDIEGYLDYQGTLFERRMDPRAYVTLTNAMDRFDVRTMQPSTIRPRLTFGGISSDWLFTPQRVRKTAERFSALGYDSAYIEIQTNDGHDGFLTEGAQLTALLSARVREDVVTSAGAAP